MQTSSEVLEGNKVKLTVEVDEADVVAAEEETLRRLTREVQLPGFRPGRVPKRLLQARLGAKGVREETLRDALPEYFADAVEEAELDIITTPEIDITSGEEGGPVVFSAIVEVRPEVLVPGYEGLVVTIPNPVASEEEIDGQIDRLREQFASLNEVDRPARDGDLVTLDIQGTRDGAPAEGLSADDLLYEVGTGGIVEGVDEKLFGAKVEDSFELDAEDAPDGPAHLKVTVKQIREKVLPDADDAFAQDASEFDTFEELRNDVAQRISPIKRIQATMALRSGLSDALAELVTDEVPETLVNERRDEIAQDLVGRLSQQQMGLAQYLAAIGQDEEEFLAELSTQALRDVKSDLALRAVAKAESLEPDESDLDEEVVHLSGHAGVTPAQMRENLEQNGRMPLLRAEIRKAKAMRWLLDHVAIVDDDNNPIDRELLRAELDASEGHHHDEHEDHAEDGEPDTEET